MRILTSVLAGVPKSPALRRVFHVSTASPLIVVTRARLSGGGPALSRSAASIVKERFRFGRVPRIVLSITVPGIITCYR